MNHYDILGIPHSADRDQITASYRRRAEYLTARLQTTRFADGRQEVLDLLHEVEDAHRVLSDPHRRMAYDMSLAPEPAAPSPRSIKVKRDDPPPVDPAVRSVQWVASPPTEHPATGRLPSTAPPSERSISGTGPVPTLAPPPEPGPGWDRRWVWAIAGVGLLAFIVGLALVTGGLRPVVVGPTAPPTAAPLVTPVPEATPVPEEPAPAPVSEATPTPPPRDLPAPPAAPAGTVGTQFTQYTNAAGGYSFVYPEDLVTPQGETGPAQRFASADGRTVVDVNAVGAAGTGIPGAFAQARRQDTGREVTYTASGASWYVVSGYEGPTLFYEKTVLTGDTFKTLRIAFPREHREAYYDAVEAMSLSFKSTR
ncbi:MAG: DnaJ domain-containing protein [Candidatus Sericytochromatia bacterium]